jgi:hypothetical protein
MIVLNAKVTKYGLEDWGSVLFHHFDNGPTAGFSIPREIQLW